MNANERSHQEAREAAATLTAYLTDQEGRPPPPGQ